MNSRFCYTQYKYRVYKKINVYPPLWMDRNRLSVSSDSLFKELAFNSCKAYDANLNKNFCQYYFLSTALLFTDLIFHYSQYLFFDFWKHSLDCFDNYFCSEVKLKVYFITFHLLTQNCVLQSFWN